MKPIVYDLIVTRHPALLDLIKELGLADDSTLVISHADVENVSGRHVLGVLPHHLSCHTITYSEIVLSIPEHLRGKELDIHQLRRAYRGINTYVVNKLNN
jgi:putative CRISPR-associated protein (TIGR02620 family)